MVSDAVGPNDAKALQAEFKKQVCQLLDQSMLKIRHCLDQIDEQQVWWRPQRNLNSIGNLLLHIAGNLNQWSTVTLEGLSDERDRDAEFSCESQSSKQELTVQLQDVVNQSQRAITNMQGDQLLANFNIQGFPVSLMEALIHTTSHFQGHTHQIILLTRLIKGDDYRFQWTPDEPRDRLPM